MDEPPAMFTPAELARMLHVDPKTVTRWCREGRLAAVVTPGGHRRFQLAVVLAFLSQMGFDTDAAFDAVRTTGASRHSR